MTSNEVIFILTIQLNEVLLFRRGEQSFNVFPILYCLKSYVNYKMPV